MERRVLVAIVVIVVLAASLSGFMLYNDVLNKPASQLNNYEISTSFTLASGNHLDLVDFNMTSGGLLWANYTASNGATLYVLTDSQYSEFSATGSVALPYFSPGSNLRSYQAAQPVNLTVGAYHVIFYYKTPTPESTNNTFVSVSNLSWYPE